jgi:hypothetical protein
MGLASTPATGANGTLVSTTSTTWEFRWNLHESGKFYVGSMYNASIQPSVPFENKKKIGKWRYRWKRRFLCGIFIEG